VSTLTKGVHGDSSEMYSQFQNVINEFKRSIGRPGV